MLLDGIANQHNDFFERQGLLDEVEGAQLRGTHSGFDGAMPGNHDHFGRSGNRLDAAERFQTVHARQPDIEKDDFKIATANALERLLSRANGIDRILFIAKNGRQRFANTFFIVDDQDFWFRTHRSESSPARSEVVAAEISATGNSIRKREPTGWLSSTRIEPPCSEMMRAAIARPRPVPRSLVEKCGRNNLSLSCGEIPCPVSATAISIVSDSGRKWVVTVISRNLESSRASAALSIRLTMTLRRSGASARTGGKESSREIFKVMPSKRPEKTPRAS